MEYRLYMRVLTLLSTMNHNRKPPKPPIPVLPPPPHHGALRAWGS